ncbi:MAG: outer membrane lipoprotein chaperone LolA [Nevskia sp.]|nr:outer membrane lipoprotein chaperone LolA [Nevskia sp.]
MACAAGLLLAAQAHAESAQDALKRFADGVQSFQAHFEQVQTDEHGKVTGRSSGHFWLARPGAAGADTGKFRWAYEKPYEQFTVCDGSKLWTYDPDLNQVTVRDARQALAGTPAELLSQKGVFTTAFNVKDGGSQGGEHTVTLLPKSKDSDFKSIELALDAHGAPLQMRFSDQIGGRSEVTFTEVSTNTRIDPAQFRFAPPQGAEIVNDGGIVTKSAE